MALECVQELAANAPAGLIIFYEQDLWLADPARVNCGALLPAFGLWQYRCGDLHRRLTVGDVVNVAAVHGVDTV
jgi:hypothetical protein